jgi:hypothetical protein
MTPTKYDGGPAREVSLRDYLAIHETSWPPESWIQAKYGDTYLTQLQDVEFAAALAAWRYQMADAMLAERKKQ